MRTLSKVTLSAGLLALALGLGACAHEEPPAVAPTPATTAPPTTTSAPAHPGVDPAVNLSSDIMTACQVKVSSDPPKFDYDSSNLSSQERDILAQVAKCLTTGPLAGKSVKLTGRADPRGEQEYNMNLGEHRATSVRKYLVGLGVADNRMTETSRGALDATGKDEAGWQADRRVDISLQ
jgi:peptidoglycan-associated lipoprotein